MRGGYPFDYYPFDYYPFDGYPIQPNHSTHKHSIFCLLSLTPDATNTMRFCSGFIFSIRTRRHLVLTQARGEGKKPQPPKKNRSPPKRDRVSASVQPRFDWMTNSWLWYRPNEPTRHPARGRKEGRKETSPPKKHTHPPSQRRRPCGRRARAGCCCPAPCR